MKILLIDNYDSFTYNLFHYLSSLKTKVQVYRNDKINDGGYREDIISNAPLSEDGFFLVPKVVD